MPSTPAALRLEPRFTREGRARGIACLLLPPARTKRFPELSGVGLQRLKTSSNLYPSTRRPRTLVHCSVPSQIQPDARASASTRPSHEFKRIYRDEELRGWPTRRSRRAAALAVASSEDLVASIARAWLSLLLLFHSAARDASTRLPAMYPQLTATSPAQLARVQPNARTSVMNSAVRIE